MIRRDKDVTVKSVNAAKSRLDLPGTEVGRHDGRHFPHARPTVPFEPLANRPVAEADGLKLRVTCSSATAPLSPSFDIYKPRGPEKHAAHGATRRRAGSVVTPETPNPPAGRMSRTTSVAERSYPR